MQFGDSELGSGFSRIGVRVELSVHQGRLVRLEMEWEIELDVQLRRYTHTLQT